MGIKHPNSRAFRVTEQGQLISATREISNITNVVLGLVDWSEIVVPAGVNCKGVVIQSRAGNAWRLGISDGAAAYLSVDGVLSMAIAAGPGTSLFWARADTVADVLEIMFLD